MFKRVIEQIKVLHHDDKGQGMAEYGLIIALIAVLCIGGFTLLGRGASSKINEAAKALE